MTEKNEEILVKFFGERHNISEAEDEAMAEAFLSQKITIIDAKTQYEQSPLAYLISTEEKVDSELLKNRPMLRKIRSFMKDPIPKLSTEEDKQLYLDVKKGRQTLIGAMMAYVNVGGGFWVLPKVKIAEEVLEERPMLSMIREYTNKGFSINFFEKEVCENSYYNIGSLEAEFMGHISRNVFRDGILTSDGTFYPLQGNCEHKDMYYWLKMNNIDVSNSIAIKGCNNSNANSVKREQRPFRAYSANKHDANNLNQLVLLSKGSTIGLYNICCLFDENNLTELMESVLTANNDFGFRPDSIDKNDIKIPEKTIESNAYACHNIEILTTSLGRRVDIKCITQHARILP